VSAANVLRETERGSGTALSLGLIAVVAFVGLMLSSLGVAQQAKWQVQTAADMAAIAGASALRQGYDCTEIARKTATQNKADITGECVIGTYGQVTVTVSRQLPAALGGRQIKTSARAGPRY